MPGCLPSAHREVSFYNILMNRNCEFKWCCKTLIIIIIIIILLVQNSAFWKLILLPKGFLRLLSNIILHSVFSNCVTEALKLTSPSFICNVTCNVQNIENRFSFSMSKGQESWAVSSTHVASKALKGGGRFLDRFSLFVYWKNKNKTRKLYFMLFRTLKYKYIKYTH